MCPKKRPFTTGRIPRSEVRKDVLKRKRDKNILQKEVREMRDRMRKELVEPKKDYFDIKQDKGGIVDIEFLVQYLVLLKAHEHDKLTIWTDNIRILETLNETGIMDDYTANTLKQAYLTYRFFVHKQNLQEKSSVIPEDHFMELREKVKEIWSFFIE